MTTWQLFIETWTWYPSVVLGCLALLVLYGVAGGFRNPRRAFWFVSGVLVLLITLTSPLDALGDEYLLSAHMLQHMLLWLAVPPLLIWGLPEAWVRRALQHRTLALVESTLRRLPLAWLLMEITTLAWHAPTLYGAALENESLHAVQHLSFLVTSVIYWWPLMTPLEETRPQVGPAIAYLFSAGVAYSILGIVLAFAPAGVYPAYLDPPDTPVRTLVRVGWGLSASRDQQVAGLLMWVGASPVFLAAILVQVAHWYRMPEGDVPLTPGPKHLLR